MRTVVQASQCSACQNVDQQLYVVRQHHVRCINSRAWKGRVEPLDCACSHLLIGWHDMLIPRKPCSQTTTARYCQRCPNSPAEQYHRASIALVESILVKAPPATATAYNTYSVPNTKVLYRVCAIKGTSRLPSAANRDKLRMVPSSASA